MADYDDLPHFVIETRGGSGAGTFLLGALLGAAAALLLAPRSGADTQRELAGAARRIRDEVEGRVSQAREDVTSRVERTRGGVTRRVEDARDAVEDRLARARAAVEAGRGAAADARDELRRRVEDAKSAYRAGTRTRDGSVGAENGDAPAGPAEIVVIERAEEQDDGELA